MRLAGIAALLATSLIWGSSFTAIKRVMLVLNSFRYTWVRAGIAVLGLLPYTVYILVRRPGSIRGSIVGGLLAGAAYTIGIWLQGWGTAYTSASNSAFITGLNVVFVHIYEALVEKRYSVDLAVSLALSVTGLYLLTMPGGGIGLGDLLVLLSAIAWAAQVIIVSRFSWSDPLVFTFFEALVALTMVIPDALTSNDFPTLPSSSLPYLVYLGLACTDVAFALQVYGQRVVSPAAAATILLMEPVFAAIIAHIVLGETYNATQLLGAAMITAAMIVSSIRGAR